VPGKWISVFINTTQGRSSERRAWLKAFSIFLTAQGGSLAISHGLHQCPGRRSKPKLQQCGIFHSGAAGGAATQGRGRSWGNPQPLFQLNSYFLQASLFPCLLCADLPFLL